MGTMGTCLSMAKRNAPSLKVFMRGELCGMVASGKMLTLTPRSMARPAFIKARAASVRLPRFTAMCMSLKKILNKGHFRSSYFPMKRK